MTFDGLRAQVQIYHHVTLRDMPKRYVSVHFMLYACWLAGFHAGAVLIWALITGLELAAIHVIRNAHCVADASPRRLLGYLSNGVSRSVLYFLPAAMLTFQSDFGFFLLALIWVLGAISGTAAMYHALPAFFWTGVFPGFVVAFVVVLAGFKMEFGPATPESWSLAVGILCLFVANTIRLLWDFRDTHKELDTTRAESLQRLRRLEHLSSHDGLTNLLNRSAFDARLAERLRAIEPGRPVAVVLLDLNGFKPINDSYGHDAGDAVIATIAKRLARSAGADAITARLGGDEFAIIAPPGMDEARIKVFASALAALVREPIVHSNAVIRISASVGIAYSSATLIRATELYAAADHAMYRAKASADDAPVLYRPDLFAPRPTLEDKNRIEVAMRKGEIGPHYQPKIELATGRICGFEALARWQHPELGLLSPGRFIDDITNLGLMPDLTYWMLRKVLIDLSGWLDEGLDPGRIAVNIPEIALATQSGREDLGWLLAEYEQCRSHITFEITEDVVIARSGDFIESSIKHFADSGISISLDDFGTGFASFQHLQHLTFDEMKIDTSFVAGLGTDPVADVIVEGFMLIARGLGVDITAEGVETEAQLAHLRQLGCTYAQGYHFSPAVPPDEARVQLIESIQARRSA